MQQAGGQAGGVRISGRCRSRAIDCGREPAAGFPQERGAHDLVIAIGIIGGDLPQLVPGGLSGLLVMRGGLVCGGVAGGRAAGLEAYWREVAVLWEAGTRLAEAAGLPGVLMGMGALIRPLTRIHPRIREASGFFPREQLAVSTQCGFASAGPGNAISEDAQENKLRLVGEIAARVWRTGG